VSWTPGAEGAEVDWVTWLKLEGAVEAGTIRIDCQSQDYTTVKD